METFYGRGVSGMGDAYHKLQAGARFYEQALESVPSTVRPTPRYGYSGGKRPVPNFDKTLLPPGLPAAEDLSFTPVFSARYAGVIATAGEQLRENDRLLEGLQEGLVRAERNRYNIRVLLSITRYLRHFVELVLALASAEDLLVTASKAAAEGNPTRAYRHALTARDRVQESIDDLYATYVCLKAVWQESRYEKGRSVDGRSFLHVMDDVKDHVADRRPDLTYLLEAEELIGLPKWVQSLEEVIGAYAARHGLDVVLREAEIMDD